MGVYESTGSQQTMQSAVNLDSIYFEEIDLNEEYAYTNNAFPSIDYNDVYTITYYDNYDALSLSLFGSNSNDYEFKPTEINFLYLEDNSNSTKTKGMPTISLTKVLPASADLQSVRNNQPLII